MWRRAYLLLALVRLYIALQPSYLHPDENFQGPEIIAGRIYGYPVHQTWEFTSENPVRGAFPLWLAYGVPMTVLKWLFEGSGHGLVRPATVFWTLRVIMFLSSFVLQDWAIHELIDSPRRRRVATLLVASSYVTCTWQVHTFSNSVETLIVAWSLVLVKRIQEHNGKHSSIRTPLILGFLLVLGVYTRITFPAFLLVPCVQIIPALIRRPFHLTLLLISTTITMLLAIYTDTVFYRPQLASFKELVTNPIITPFNALRYNTQAANLALHGTHPFYQHVLVNLPQLLGPALPLLLYKADMGAPFVSSVSGLLLLSAVPHQEARFLLPAVPLLLTSVRLPSAFHRTWLAVWMIFNALLALLMGVYHQGGVMPAQMWLESQQDFSTADVYWWKTYSPPTWLLNGRIDALNTNDLMGLPSSELQNTLCQKRSGRETLLAAPRSATFLDRFQQSEEAQGGDMSLTEAWSTKSHINLDDLDFGDDGVLPTLRRVIGRRGLVIWKVECPASHLDGAPNSLKDW